MGQAQPAATARDSANPQPVDRLAITQACGRGTVERSGTWRSTTSPPTRRRRSSGCRCGPTSGGTGWSSPRGRESSPRAGSTSAPACCCVRQAPPVEAREVLDLGCGYGVIGLAIAVAVPEVRVTAVDVNERALLLARENAERMGVADRFSARAPRRGRPRGGVRRDLVQPADQGGQGGPAPAAAAVAAAAAPRGSSGDGGREEPRLGLVGEVARRAGLPDREAGQRQGLPGPGVAPALRSGRSPSGSR